MTAHWITCPYCGAKRNKSGDYTSPANREKDAREWREEHESGACRPAEASADHYNTPRSIPTPSATTNASNEGS